MTRSNKRPALGRERVRGAGRDASATAGLVLFASLKGHAHKAKTVKKLLTHLCKPLNFHGQKSVPAWDTQS